MKHLLALAGFIISSACSSEGLVSSGPKIDAKNADTFGASVLAASQELSEEERQKFGQDLLYLFESLDDPSSAYRNLYPQDFERAFRDREVAQKLSLEGAELLDGKSSKSIHEIANKRRAESVSQEFHQRENLLLSEGIDPDKMLQCMLEGQSKLKAGYLPYMADQAKQQCNDAAQQFKSRVADFERIRAQINSADTIEDIDLSILELDVPLLSASRCSNYTHRCETKSQDRLIWNKYFPWDPSAPGVQTTESGLQYVKLIRGPASGYSPVNGQFVEVHYEGRIADTGVVFDSSFSRGKPEFFPSDKLIPGWVEALALMKPGDRWMILVPSSLAYGEKGSPGGPIPPHADLQFEVQLIRVLE